MALQIFDRIQETTQTIGTISFVLDGVASGPWVSFAGAGVGNGDTVYYCAVSQNSNDWEVGLGTRSGTSLARTSVDASSNSNALVDFAPGTKAVFGAGSAQLLRQILTSAAAITVLEGDVTALEAAVAALVSEGSSVLNVAALTALTTTPSTVQTRCYSAIANGGSGTWVFRTGNQAANVTADPRKAFWAAPDSASTGSSGAWQRLFTDPIDPRWGGAIGDGTTDDTTAINGVVSAVSTLFGTGTIDMTFGRWLIDSANLLLKQGVFLVGSWRNVGKNDTPADFTATKSTIVINSSFTIVPQENAGLEGLILYRKGLTVPTNIREGLDLVRNFAGTAVTVGTGVTSIANDFYAHQLLILGFENAIVVDYVDRPHISFVSGDCTNGISINDCYDMDQVSDCHFWEYLTTHNAWSVTTYAVSGAVSNGGLVRLTTATQTLTTGDIVTVWGVGGVTGADGRFTVTVINATTLDLQGSTFGGAYTSGGTVYANAIARHGTAYTFGPNCDWAQARDCFCYGYDVGYLITESFNAELVNCGADHYADAFDTTTIGFQIDDCDRAKLIGPKMAALGRGLVVDLTDADYRMSITSFGAWGNMVNHINVVTGGAVITSGLMGISIGGVWTGGILIASGAATCIVANNSAPELTTPISVSGAASRKLICEGNEWTDAAGVGNQMVIVASDANFFRAEYSGTAGSVVDIPRKSRGTPSSPTVATNGDPAYFLTPQVHLGSGAWGYLGFWGVRLNGVPSGTSSPGLWELHVTPTGAITPALAMTVTEAGTIVVNGFNVFTSIGTNIFAIDPSAPTSGQTVAYLYYHNGTGLVLERVTVGAADSGGAGFKVLRVPN